MSNIVYKATLAPIGTDRFQPTGFPDLGPALYRTPNGTHKCLVESEQSVANRLEKVCWDSTTNEVVDSLKGLPYVRVFKDGEYLTSSLTEALRMDSVYVRWTKFMSEVFFKQVTRKNYIQSLLQYDPNSLIHGCWLSSHLSGVCRTPRLLSGFVEATGVLEALSGGVKIDHINPSTEEGKKSDSGFGMVPHNRSDFVAEKIEAVFKIDMSLLKSFGFEQDVQDALLALCDWKIASFLDSSLRLRSRCDLEVVSGNTPKIDDDKIRSAMKVLGRFPVTVTEYGDQYKDTSKEERKKEEEAKKAAKKAEKEAKAAKKTSK